jgi:predicted dehydrogenase
MAPLGVAIVGCGVIADAYATDVRAAAELELTGVFDVRPAALAAFAERHDARAYASLDDLLADPAVAIVVNLTAHTAHYAVSKAALEAGRHVYSEKPLTLDPAEAQELVAIAERNGVRLSGSPSVWLGPASQTAWREVERGAIGTVRVVYANVDHGRIETWHPDPAGFYAVGPVFDVGVYPIALLTAVHGPVRAVRAVGAILMPDRVTKRGEPFRVTADDFVTAMLTMADGALVRLTCSFYVGASRTVGEGIEFHGDDGSVLLSSWTEPRASVRRAPFGGEWSEVELCPGEGGERVEWSRGLKDLARAIDEGRPHRASGEHAAHVVEVVDAIRRASASGDEVAVTSSFPPPEPIGWTRSASA